MGSDDNILDRIEKTGFEFLLTDLNLAMTMTRIASDSMEDREKKSRNQENARKAYDAVLHLSRKAMLNEHEQGEVNGKLSKLRSALEALGEVF